MINDESISRCSYLVDLLMQVQGEGRGLRKHLFAYSEENPTELNALQKEYMQICKTQANSQRLHQFDNTTNYRNECKYPQKYDNGNMSRGH